MRRQPLTPRIPPSNVPSPKDAVFALYGSQPGTLTRLLFIRAFGDTLRPRRDDLPSRNAHFALSIDGLVHDPYFGYHGPLRDYASSVFKNSESVIIESFRPAEHRDREYLLLD